MNVAIGAWTLLLGGWTLPGAGVPDIMPPSPFTPRPAVERGSSIRRPQARPTDRRALPQRQRGGRSSILPGTGILPGRGQQATASQQSYMPLPPTHPAAASEAFPLLPPTAYSPSGRGRSTGQQRYGQPYVSYAARQAADRASRGSRRTAKPYSNYRPSPAISPYLNLFRFQAGEEFSNVNTYYTQVKPFVDQRFKNTQFGGQISKLKNASRFTSTALRYLGRESRTLQGTALPQYHMNYQGYFPGFGN